MSGPKTVKDEITSYLSELERCKIQFDKIYTTVSETAKTIGETISISIDRVISLLRAGDPDQYTAQELSNISDRVACVLAEVSSFIHHNTRI
jgi:hypothetical protein